MTDSRRAFLRKSLTSAFGFALLNPFQTFALPAQRKSLPSWTMLVEYARWCPTVHNLQPHKIKIISETEAELYYDPARLLPVGDPDGVFVTVALGVFVEHLSIVAGSYEARVVITEVVNTVKTSDTEYTLFAKLKIIPTAEKEPLDQELIKKRRTSRLPYEKEIVSAELLEKLKIEAEKFDHRFFSSSEEDVVDFVVKLNQETLFHDLESAANRHELHQLFRYTESEAEEKKDGLWAACMGFRGGLMKSVFTHYRRWTTGVRKKMLANLYKSSFKGTTTICWFEGVFNDSKQWLVAGKMLARTWLLMTKDGAYMQPFGSLITNETAYQKISERFSKTETEKIWLIFRVGYSKEPARSYRLSTEEIIIS